MNGLAAMEGGMTRQDETIRGVLLSCELTSHAHTHLPCDFVETRITTVDNALEHYTPGP